MERDWLARELDAGRSIEAIAREVRKDASTVAYWVRKHGLKSRHAERHAARGGLSKEVLAPLVEEGLSVREIAAEVDRSLATVRHWLKENALVTERAARRSTTRPLEGNEVERDCAVHGRTRHGLRS